MENKQKSSNEAHSEPLQQCNVIRFYFKVKNSKLDNPEKLQHQINLVLKRLVKIHNINSEKVEVMFGTFDDDFIYDRCRLLISFNCV